MSGPVLAHGYPSPALVLGVGRLGLAVLERLGAEWQLRSESGDDATSGNLRLISVLPQEHCDRPGLWRAREARALHLAGQVGVSDMATLATDFALLRSLGLIRFHQASYEVAVPANGELYKRDPKKGSDGMPEDGADVYRRRYFRWLSLGTDPLAAVERLALARERDVELELFVSPLLGRVRLGHVPRAIVTTLIRMRAYREGRDPSPWEWAYGVEPSDTGASAPVTRMRVPLDELYAPANVARATPAIDATGPSGPDRGPSRYDYIPLWARDPAFRSDDGYPLQRSFEDAAWHGVLAIPAEPGPLSAAGHVEFVVPRAMLPDPELRRINGGGRSTGLLVDATWVAAYLAAEWSSSVTNTGLYRIFPTSLYRLGLYDHDSTPSNDQRREAFSDRLRRLSAYVEQGLLRLWSDLERDPGFDVHEAADGRGRDSMAASVLQSLNLLGEALVRPAIRSVTDEFTTEDHLPSEDALAACPSPLLQRLALPAETPQDDVTQKLLARLANLGIVDVPKEIGPRRLLECVRLEPRDVDIVSADLPDAPHETDALLQLRASVNRAYRELYNDAFLRRYRADGGKSVPRLTVVVVGDISEPFVRATARLVLREANAELRRSLGPIFSSERGGPQRYVSILPVIWAPHPPDAARTVATRARVMEEAALHHCIHGLRRWIESVPTGQRSIRQIYLNGRVTDNTVLDTRDVLDQTCAFLSLVLRNPLEDDPMLRMVHAPSSAASSFASFACRELDFPERRARDYLALKFGIYALRHLQRAPGGDRPEAPVFDHGPAAATELQGPASAHLDKMTAADAEAVAALVRDRAGVVDRESAPEELAERFKDVFDAELDASIIGVWKRLVRDAGGMDALVQHLRARVNGDTRDKLTVLRRSTDRVMREQSIQHGIQHAQVALASLAHAAGRELDAATSELDVAEGACLVNGVPSTGRLPSARKALVEAIRRKPDWTTILYGVVLFATVGLMLGGPIFWAISSAYDLHLRPGVLEAILFHGGPAFAAALCGGLAWWGLGRLADARTDSVKEALSAYARIAYSTVAGDGPPSSVRSFLRARLAFATAAARRGHADVVHDQARADAKNATRVLRSAAVQTMTLRRRLEALGVRIALRDSGDLEDVSRLFDARDGVAGSVQKWFQENYGAGSSWKELSLTLVEEAGHFDRWRDFAPLSETNEVLDVGRRHFRRFIETPVVSIGAFGPEALQQVHRFVKEFSGQLGFGADFDGLEGMDADNNVFVQRRIAVVPPALAQVIEAAHIEDPARYAYLDTHDAVVRANSAWLLSLANGLSARVVRTFSRYESSLDRGLESPTLAFPFAMEFVSGSEPVNILTGAVDGDLLLGALPPVPLPVQPPALPNVLIEDPSLSIPPPRPNDDVPQTAASEPEDGAVDAASPQLEALDPVVDATVAAPTLALTDHAQPPVPEGALQAAVEDGNTVLDEHASIDDFEEATDPGLKLASTPDATGSQGAAEPDVVADEPPPAPAAPSPASGKPSRTSRKRGR
jgi:hypothetical protein